VRTISNALVIVWKNFIRWEIDEFNPNGGDRVVRISTVRYEVSLRNRIANSGSAKKIKRRK
jgi:hypothetical protein